MTRPKLVTFDVYMALLDIEGSLVSVVSEELGLETDRARPFVQLWRAKQMERAAISNSLEKERTSFRAATEMALDYVAGRQGIAIDAEKHRRLVMAWDTMRPWPEANDVIAAIKSKGIETAILSNGDQDMLEAVARLFPAGFNHILSSETAGKYKPHPSVYDLPTTVLSIAKADVLHVAGSANDVLGTIAAGMRCIWSNRHSDLLLDPAYAPEIILDDLSGVVDLI
ncbi:MAG: haloacid dehalogenase type II [Pseudomonadota bacterium]